MKPLQVYVGFDPRQCVAYTALHTSILMTCSKPVSITPLVLETLPIKVQGLTPFTYSRFLVPWLCNFEGQALFMDSDTICLDDISKLFDMNDGSADVLVSKNKLRFEWPSVMLFNNDLCRLLTPDFIENNPKDCMKLDWARKVGDLPSRWNHLVGYDDPQDVSIVHFTQGIPCHPEVKGCEFSDEWHMAAGMAMKTQNWQSVMGNSVHAEPVMQRLAQRKAEKANGATPPSP